MGKPGEDERVPRRWFYRKAGRLHGPMTIGELQASVVLGFVRQDDLVQERLLGRWTPAAQVPGLQSLRGRFHGALTEHMADSPGAGVEG